MRALSTGSVSTASSAAASAAGSLGGTSVPTSFSRSGRLPDRGRDHRRGGRHRLERREPESLVRRRDDDDGRAAVQRCEVGVVHRAAQRPVGRAVARRRRRAGRPPARGLRRWRVVAQRHPAAPSPRAACRVPCADRVSARCRPKARTRPRAPPPRRPGRRRAWDGPRTPPPHRGERHGPARGRGAASRSPRSRVVSLTAMTAAHILIVGASIAP